ncbi:MAG: steroid 5-alpha reductase family enzyme [Cellvibrionaceae bacterium]|jgi:steroid 5-alpha reductase family enzyme
MTEAEKKSLIAIPIIILLGAGLASAGSQGGMVVGRFPLYAVCISLAFIVNWIVFIHAYSNRTEKFFDLTGGITYLTVTVVAVWLSGSTDLRSIVLAAIIIIWAMRLSLFLFRRIRADGHDGRFDAIKHSFIRSLTTWTLQGLWVSFSAAAGLAAITSANKVPLGIIGIIGLLIWIIGFGLEVVADQQKKQFRADLNNKGKFITSGVWSWSRHPNYFGEIVLWVGVAIIALPVLNGWQYVTLISPIFIYLLLTRVSGVPLLEARADEKWGGQEDYEAYKLQTSVLIPRPPTG